MHCWSHSHYFTRTNSGPYLCSKTLKHTELVEIQQVSIDISDNINCSEMIYNIIVQKACMGLSVSLISIILFRNYVMLLCRPAHFQWRLGLNKHCRCIRVYPVCFDAERFTCKNSHASTLEIAHGQSMDVSSEWLFSSVYFILV